MIKTENIHIVSSYFGPQQIKHILLHIHSYRGCSKLQMGPMEKKTRQRIYTLAFDKKTLIHCHCTLRTFKHFSL